MFSGQGQSVALWWMALLPLLAGYVLGQRAALGWLAMLGLVVTAVHLSPFLVVPRPEFLSGGLDLWVRQISAAIVGLLVGGSTVQALRLQRAELTEARDRAQSAVKARASFLAGISHELRTPLTGLLGMTEIMRQEPDGAGREATISEIVRNGEVLARLIEQILEFSRIDEAGADLQLGVHDPRVLVEDALMSSAPTAWEKGLVLTHVIDPDVEGMIRCDGQRLGQVLSNLVNNAVKYTDAGFVHVRLFQDGEQLALSVEDSGPGLNAEQIELALVPFKRLRHGPIPGTGLGLPSVDSWCRSMGGALTIDSEPGVGSTFTARVVAEVVARAALGTPTVTADIADLRLRESVLNALGTLPESTSARLVDGLVQINTPTSEVRVRWPVRLARLAPAPIAPVAERTPSPVQRVVVVDDVPVIRLVVSRFVELAGAEVAAFCDGAGAMEHLESNDADLVLLDMWLAEELGPNVARSLHERWPDLRIVAMSASVQAEDRQTWLDAGVTEFLAKPIDVQELGIILEG